MNNKKQKGITLIALVVTIIILLILAGISVSILSGEEGLITMAKKARLETAIASGKEKIEMELLDLSTERISKGESCTLEYVGDNIGRNGIEVVGKKGEPIVKVYVSYEGNMYKIVQDLEVTYVGDINIKGEPEIEIIRDSTITGVEQVKLSVNATVEEGEISEIVMPDGKKEYKDKVEYTVTENGEYTFKAVTANGQEETKTVKIETIKEKGAIEIGTSSSDTGSGQVQCEHQYETRYNDTQHWQQCIFCADKKGETNHNITIEGTDTCDINVPVVVELCNDCGFKKDRPKKQHNYDYNNCINYDWSGMHGWKCKDCGALSDGVRCKDAEGNSLGCSTGIAGICARLWCDEKSDSLSNNRYSMYGMWFKNLEFRKKF